MVMKFLRRRKTAKIILWITAILIIPGFLFWGIGITSSSRSKSLAATVNREPVSLREVYQRVSETDRRYRQIFGDSYEKIVANLNLEKQVLDQLIRERILSQQARKRRIRVLDSEVVDVIKADPAFRDEKGAFSQEKFTSILKNVPKEELRKIEDSIRKQVTLQKLRQQVISETSIQVSDQELEQALSEGRLPAGTDRDAVRKMLAEQKGEQYFARWLERTRKAAKVIIYLESAQEKK